MQDQDPQVFIVAQASRAKGFLNSVGIGLVVTAGLAYVAGKADCKNPVEDAAIAAGIATTMYLGSKPKAIIKAMEPDPSRPFQSVYIRYAQAPSRFSNVLMTAEGAAAGAGISLGAANMMHSPFLAVTGSLLVIGSAAMAYCEDAPVRSRLNDILEYSVKGEPGIGPSPS